MEGKINMATYDFDALIDDGSLIQILSESEWKNYQPLCDLVAGTDYENNSAWYWSYDHPANISVLHKIIFQLSINNRDWTDCISIKGDEATAFFPSHNNVKAKAGFYLPDLSYFGKLRDIQFRACAPRKLINLVEK